MPRGSEMEQAGARVLPAEMEFFREVEQDEKVIARIAPAQREELEQEIEELVGSSPF